MRNKSEKEFNVGLKLIAKSGVVVFAGLIISKILTYVYRIIVARFYGPEVYGLFSLALMLSALFIAFASFGLTQGLLRYTALYRGKKENSKIKYIYGFVGKILVVSGILSGLVLFLGAEFISISIFKDAGLTIFLKVFAFAVPLGIISNIYLSILRAFEKVGWHTFIVNVFENFMKVALLVLLILIGFNSNSVSFSYMLGMVGVLILSFFVGRYFIARVGSGKSLSKKEKKGIVRELFAYSWPFLLLVVVARVLTWVDTFVIGYYLDSAQVGFYNAAVPIAILLLFASDAFMRLFFPLITREYSKKRTEVIQELSKQVTKWIFILNVPVFLLIIVFPGEIIGILFGQEYRVASTSLQLLAVGFFASSMFSTIQSLILMTGKSKIRFYNKLFVLIFNLVLNIILVPRYGIDGAAFATMVSLIALSVIHLVESKVLLSFVPFRRKMLRVVMVGVLSLGILLFVKQFFNSSLLNFVVLGGFFVLIYVVLIIITGSLDRNDFMVLRAFMRKFS
jgi:O-antigen/teichoic acid export membrane protein